MGSSTYISDAAGLPHQFIGYMPFGNSFTDIRTESKSTNYRFTGKEQDAETGLYYYGARYYDPNVGRFLSVDPLADKFNSWSPYHYATNNPINVIDYDGRDTLNVHRGALNEDLSDEYTNVWNVTFSLTQNGKTTALELSDGTSEVYMFGNRSLGDVGDNRLNQDIYSLKFENMPSNADLPNTIRVGGDGFGVFIHAGNDFSKFAGCKRLCKTYDQNGANAWGDGSRQFYGNNTQGTLDMVRGLYDQHSANLTGENFLLRTNLVAPTRSSSSSFPNSPRSDFYRSLMRWIPGQ